ncbi:MAG TPA: thiamine pyrophosphate-dependent enzyme [Solirubrobacteraceae bacterium]
MTEPRRGGHVLADALVGQGCDLAFCVPGESYLPLLDGLYAHRETVRVITCRHESAAANAADAYGKLTGRPGLCMVTRGPGATQAAVGVHTASQDSTPFLLLVGQVARHMRGREAFQEIDCSAVFGSMAKGVFEIDDPQRIPEIVASAYSLALGGRQGPVVISLPEDVLSAAVEDEPAAPPRTVARQPAADPADVARLRDLLQRAERPMVLVGGGPWDREACRHLSAWAGACTLPVAASFRRQDVLDNASSAYVGDVGLGVNPALAQRLRDCDLFIALGPRLTEIETQGYTVPGPPVARQMLVHAHPDPRELGRVYQPALGIVAGMSALTAALDAGCQVAGDRWAQWTASARADYENWSALPEAGDRLDLGAAIAVLRELLPADTVYCNGAGNYTVWVHRFTRYRRWGTQLAPQSGAMGYGIPAAIAAQLVHPDRRVVAFAGDGCFQMCGQELATMVAEDLPVIVVVANNGMLGTIRMHQERRFPRRVIATDLVNPRFDELARAYGAHGERVERAEDVLGAVQRARDSRRPALIELICDPDALTPSTSLSSLTPAPT